MERLTSEELDAIRVREEKTTAGPWWATTATINNTIQAFAARQADAKSVAYIETQDDAEFIANAREDVPKLLAEVSRLQAENSYKDGEIALQLAEVERLTRANQQLFENREKWRVSHGELESDVERLNNQISDLVCTIYEHADEGTALMELAEAIDSDEN